MKAEEQKVKSGNFPPNTSVVIQDLMKVYGSSGFGRKPFYAVKGINLTLQNNQLFCLLGPNGAGIYFNYLYHLLFFLLTT